MSNFLGISLNLIGKLIYNSLYSWVKSWGSEFELLGAFAVTVILFTLFLKTAMLPLDFWTKASGRKNARKMEIMKPELDKVTKQCGDNRELLMQKQREVHKKYKYSAFSSCLPALVTMAMFIVVLTGFNSAVRYHNYVVFEELSVVYHETYSETILDANLGENPTEDQITAAEATATKKAEEAVIATYKPEQFLLTTNIFMPDSWKSPIPSISDYKGSGMGKLNIQDVDAADYNRVMKPIFEEYNYNDSGKKVWNGYLILPIISFVLSILSAKLVKPPEQPAMAGQTEEQVKMQKNQAKMMQYLMPIMMGVFTLFYSTAFALYMVMSSLFTTIFNVLYNMIAKRVDEKAKDKYLSTTIKK